LDAVAAHYAAGAETPITGQMIADFNPGVTAAVGAVYLIPPFTYVVAAAPDPTAAPGNTFAAMAAYYPSSIDQLATCAADVANLFPSSTQLRIDGQMFDLRPELGPANVGIALERANLGEPVWPDNPTQPQKDAYAQATMFSLYSLLSTGLADNVFYDVSPFSQPFGPQDFSDAPSDASAFDSHARRLARRRRAFDAAVEADYTYRQSIGIPAALAAVNAAPAGAAAPLDAALNPYLGVGAPTQAALRWQDLFGNTTVTPFVAPAADYAGALNGAVVPLRYGDRLIGLSDWRNTRASYVYSAGGGSPALALGIALDAAAYAGDDGAARAQEDFGLYRQIYFQLNQNYDGQKVPGVDGQAVAMQLHNSLTGGQPIDLDDPQSAQVRDFARDAALYLNAIAIGAADPPPAPETTLTFPVDVAGIVDDTVVPLDVNLTFVRQAVLTEPTVAALADGLAVESPIGPTPDPGGDTAAYTTFAAALEAIFQTDAWFLRVGEGLREAGATDDARDQQLFTVRFGKQAGQGVYFTVGDAPSYYAPAPVATTLESDTVTIAQYPSGTTEQLDFTAVDLNLWFQTYLDGIDTFLSATYSPHAFILDQLEGVTDPLRDGQLGRVLQTKQSLADTISASVLPILSTSATDDATRASAQETLRQRLLNQIGVAYAAGAVTVFGLDSVSGAPPSTPAGPPNLYGQPGGTIAGQAIDNENYSLSAARVPLGPVETPQGATVAPRLAFVFSSKNVTTQPFVALDQATLSISHMEIDRTTVPGIEGYVQSRWLAFVSGPFDVPLGASTLDIPVLNRTLPTPPTMLAQSADKHVLNPSTPTELAQWDYAFRYLNQQAAQDAVLTEIQLNRPQSAGLASRALADGPSLFETLAQFITTYPAILADFNAHLVAIDGAGGDAPNQAPAAVAVKAFADAVENVAIAYAAHMQGVAQALAIAPQLITVRFRSLLSNADGQARSDLLNLTINDQAATWNPGTGTITAGAITLPQTVIEIDPGDYEPEPVTPLPPNVDVSYRYRSRAPSGEPTYLPYDQAQQDPNRTIAMRGLDALAHQSGWSSIEVERNLVLFPLADIGSVSTNPAFRFQTPVVRFANPIIPRLVYASYDLAATPGGSTTLQDELDAFFAALYAEGTGAIDVKISMEGLYAYALVSVDGVPRVRLPVDLLPPTLSPVDPSQPPAFVAPFADAVDTWRSANNPTTSGDPTLDIRFEAFSNESTTKQPLLKIDRLVYAIDD
ncbi:MAG: peptidoglycan-binding protein, partial [Acidobacteriota bacterium]